MDKEKIKEKVWEFEETREKLIKMVQSYVDKKYGVVVSWNIVDAIFLATCEYKDNVNPPKEVVVPIGLETFRKSFIKTMELIKSWRVRDAKDIHYGHQNDTLEEAHRQGINDTIVSVLEQLEELKSLIQTFRKV